MNGQSQLKLQTYLKLFQLNMTFSYQIKRNKVWFFHGKSITLWLYLIVQYVNLLWYFRDKMKSCGSYWVKLKETRSICTVHINCRNLHQTSFLYKKITFWWKIHWNGNIQVKLSFIWIKWIFFWTAYSKLTLKIPSGLLYIKHFLECILPFLKIIRILSKRQWWKEV